ncbi:MAG TPA: methyltransferase [Phycisphaerae bacterium]|nr:methyltransferase [Phycisphaerae bacterium]
MRNGQDIMELGQCAWEARIVSAAAEVGVFDAIDERGRSARSIARRCRLDERATELLLNALAGLGLVRLRGQAYSARPVVKRCLQENSPQSVTWMLRHHNQLAKSWAQLDDVLRRGGPVRREQQTRRAAEGTERFIRAMHDNSRTRAAALAHFFAGQDFRTMLDAGGGSGAYCQAFCRRWPKLQATLFDRPDVLKVARKIVGTESVGRRIHMVEGDLNDDPLPQGFDLVLLSNVIHSSGPDEIRLWFRKIYKALVPGGTLVIHDFLTNAARTQPKQAAVFAVNMLINTAAGRTYSHAELADWLRRANFSKIRRAEPAEPTSGILIARRA